MLRTAICSFPCDCEVGWVPPVEGKSYTFDLAVRIPTKNNRQLLPDVKCLVVQSNLELPWLACARNGCGIRWTWRVSLELEGSLRWLSMLMKFPYTPCHDHNSIIHDAIRWAQFRELRVADGAGVLPVEIQEEEEEGKKKIHDRVESACRPCTGNGTALSHYSTTNPFLLLLAVTWNLRSCPSSK